ncbi:MAG: putative metalloprotease with PDZ domain [Glaciecola sp.]|jgi:predicted metalloprotease with PDZ domain
MTDMLSYHIVPENLAEHVFNVKISIPASKHAIIHLSIPAWIPGSYMIRDFCKNIHSLHAESHSGQKLETSQIDKQTWQIANASDGLMVTYQVYAFDLSVRGAYLFDEYAFFNGTSTFLEVKEFTDNASSPISLCIENNQVDKNWQLCTSYQKHSVVESNSIVKHYFTCEDYQELIDHPVLLGQVEQASFEVADTNFHVVFSGKTETDLQRICQDLKPLCQHHINLFGALPEKDYWFLTLLSDDGFGGLEHRASTALLYPRFHLPMRSETELKSEHYQRFLSLCSHELFHAWNVKRIKPQIMISPELSSEQYSEQLWIYEGFTSLYDDLSLARANIIDPQRYIEILGENLTRLKQTQGRHKQSITESSINAWTKFYKQDAGSHNHIVSYYNKGAVIALALDITLREMSENRYSIDQIMQILWQEYGSCNIGTPDDVIQQLCKKHFQLDISEFLNTALYCTDDLPLDALVKKIGLKLHYRTQVSQSDKGGKPSTESIKHAFGATYKDQDSGLLLQTMRDGSPIARAGAQLGDILIALGQWQVNSGNLQRLLDNQVSSHVEITLLRQGRILRAQLPIEAAKADTAYFTIEDTKKFQCWIDGSVD